MTRLDQIDVNIASLTEERKLAEIEDDFVKQKAVGLEQTNIAKAAAFKIASSLDEYEALVAEIPPPDLGNINQELNAARFYYRTNYRQPGTEGASPDVMGASVHQLEAVLNDGCAEGV